MKFRYRMIESQITDEQGNTHQTYGIEAYATVKDLSVNRFAVATLIEKCNRLALSPIHLMDVAEDFVAAEYSL